MNSFFKYTVFVWYPSVKEGFGKDGYMRRKNIAVRNWIRNKKRFADLFNGVVFQGEQVILPEDLEVMDSEADIIVTDKNGKKKGVQRYRDVVMLWKKKVEFAILACENQEKVHYAMPVRTMLYDGLSYMEQVKEVWKEHQDTSEKLTEEEYLSRFRRNDKICPIITLVLYYGSSKAWDGGKDLYEMFKFDEAMRHQELMMRYIPNYHINLIDMTKLENLHKFRTDLQVVLGMLRYKEQKDKLLEYLCEHEEYFRNADVETYQAVCELLNSEKLLKLAEQETEGKVIDVCKALDDLYNDGIEFGKNQGEFLKIISQVRKKMMKNISAVESADMLEEEYSLVQRIYAILEMHSEWEDFEVYRELKMAG